MRLQAKLLRALQESEIDRLGGSAPVQGQCAACSQPPIAICRPRSTRTFREDLYFRLNVVSLRSRRCANGPAISRRWPSISPVAIAEVNGLPFRPLSRRRAAARLRIHGAAMCANWRMPSIAPCCWPTADRSDRGHRARPPAPPAARPSSRRRCVAGRPADGGGGARPDHRDAGPHCLATARMRRPFSASRSARCATSCVTTPRRAFRAPAGRGRGGLAADRHG